MLKKVFYLSVFFLAFAVFAQATQLKKMNLESISVINGLTSNSVQAIIQDHMGYMWFGTTNGLNRYDGKTIKTYQISPFSKQSISDSRVNCLLLANHSQLLIGTERGLNVYIPEKDIVIPYAATASINDQRIRTMAEDGNLLWIGTNRGLYRLNKTNGELTMYNIQNSGLVNNIVRSIYVDEDNLYLGTFDGVSRFNKKNKQWLNVNLKPDYIKQPQNNLVLSIEQSPFDKNILLIGTQTGLGELDKSTLKFTLHEKSRNTDMVNNTIKTMCNVAGSMWLGSEEGVMIFNHKNFANFGYIPVDQHSLPNNIVWSIYKGRDNIVWMGTEGGVAKYDAGIPEFSYFDFTKAEGNPYVGMFIFASQIDKNGEVWMGSRFGLSHYNPTSNRMEWVHFSNVVSGTYNFIKGLHLDQNDVLWVGTAEGIVCYDTRLKREIPIQQRLNHRLKYINELKQADDGRICACDVSGRIQLVEFTFDPRKRLFTQVKDEFVAVGEDVVTMTIDRNYIWLGTAGNGLIRFDRKERAIKKYMSLVDDHSTICSNIINYLFIDKKTGILWVGTDKGLNYYNRKEDKFARLSANEVLGPVYTIQNDQSGLLWFTTRQSIVCYDQTAKKINFFPLRSWMDISKNIPSVTFSDNSNNVYIMGLDGYVRVNRANIKQKRINAPLYITDIKVANRSIIDYGLNNGQPIEKLKKIILEHNYNVISFYFSMLDFSSSSLVRYRYMLSHYDSDWKTIDGTTPYIEYSKLSPGKYNLRIQAFSSEGIKASNEISLDIKILPPWWLSWWAYLIYILLLATIFHIVNYNIRKRRLALEELKMVKLQQEKLEEINQVKLRFFTNISHDFKTPLSLIISPVESMLDKETEPEKINNLSMIKQNAQRLLRLVNQIIDFRKVENQKMQLNIQSSDIIEVIKNISSSFSELAHKNGIAFLFETDIDHLVMDFDLDKIEKIFFNLISNAIKFMPNGGQVILSIHLKETDQLEIMIADTGIGIPSNDLQFIFDRFYQVGEHAGINTIGSGIGLTIVKEFIELHKGTIKVLSKKDVGTSFFVTLPVVNANNEEYNEATGKMTDGENPSRILPEAMSKDFMVLLIEDDEDMRNYLQLELGKTYKVTAVDHAEAGYKIVREQMPDIVISDIMLPNMSGIEMCKLIKKEFVTSHIPVILLTAKTAEESIIEGFEAGADEYIGKPFNLKILRSRIDNIISQRQKLRDKLKRDTIETSPVEKQSPNEIFINKVVALIEDNLSDPDLNIAFLCDKLAISHVYFYRKIKAMTGLNVNAFIRDLRLKKAAKLLQMEGHSVTDVMYEVGFNNRSYFSMCFRELFGDTPKSFAQRHHNETILD